jgi:hypothetical protein
MYYLHLLDLWSSQLVGFSPGESHKIPGVNYLDNYPPYCPVSFYEKTATASPSPALALMYLRLRARGYLCVTAAERLSLTVQSLLQLMKRSTESRIVSILKGHCVLNCPEAARYAGSRSATHPNSRIRLE